MLASKVCKFALVSFCDVSLLGFREPFLAIALLPGRPVLEERASSSELTMVNAEISTVVDCLSAGVSMEKIAAGEVFRHEDDDVNLATPGQKALTTSSVEKEA